MKKVVLLVSALLVGCASSPQRNDADNSQRNRAKVHTELGFGYFSQGQMGIALDEFNFSIKIDPAYALPYAGLGLVHANLNQDTQAEANFKRALQLEPNNSETHNNYGTFLCSRGRFSESIQEFLTATKNPLYTTPGMAYLNAGTCALKNKDDKNAETYLNNALQIQPNIYQAHVQLTKLFFGREDYFMARQHLQKALENTDPTPELLWLGVRIEKNLGGGDNESSYRLLLKNKFPDSAETKAMLAGE